jgi:transposase
VERAEGGALDRAEERLGEGSCPTGLGVSEEGAYEPSGSQALKRPGSRLGRARSFQKSLPERLKEIRKTYPEAQVELWAEDEARLGLKPVMRRVWAPVGKRPIARFKRGYKWTYLYGFVRPESGEVYWLILPRVNTELFSMALDEFAREVAAGKDKRVLLVVDQAGWHTGKEVEVPEGIHLEFLPSGSPELQPAERLWPLTNEAVANGLFEEIEEIEEALVERCLELLDQTETIKNLTNYHWWPQAA